MFFWSQIYVLWCETLCSLANPARLFSPVHIYVRGHFFLCATLMSWKSSQICTNVFLKSNICSVMWNFVLARKSGTAIFTCTYLCTGTFFFCVPPLWVEKLAKICPNVFLKSNICFVMWNFVLTRKSGATIFTRTYLCTGTFFFVCHPYELEN